LVHRENSLEDFAHRAASTIHRAVPGDGVCLLTLDPATLLPTGEYVENGLPPAATPRLGEIERHEPDFNKFVDLARQAVPAASLSAATGGDLDRSRRQRELRRPSGFGDELRAALGDSSGTWAALTLLRERGRPDFTRTDVEFLASTAGILAEGVRRSLLTGARPSEGDSFAQSGLLVLAPDGSLETADRNGDRWLGLVGGGGDARSGLPMVVHAVADQARRDDSGELATARVRTTRGEWIVVRGSVLGSGPDARVAIRLEPARPPQLAPLLVAAFGLTPREREVTELVARGHTTADIAALLEITTYTVQDHLKAIFEKSGSGSRGELVAQLFIDGRRPDLTVTERAEPHST
jgi:DNA-binding CsgD family transcriptional regulator